MQSNVSNVPTNNATTTPFQLTVFGQRVAIISATIIVPQQDVGPTDHNPTIGAGRSGPAQESLGSTPLQKLPAVSSANCVFNRIRLGLQ